MERLGISGHVNVDWIIDTSTDPPTERGPFYGGVGGNIAIAAARFGIPVVLTSVVGSDFPEEYMEALRASGVDTGYLEVDEGTTTSVCRLTYRPDGGVDKEMDHGPQHDDRRPPVEFLDGVDHLHISTGFPLPSLWLAKNAFASRVDIGFDPGADLARHYNGTNLLSMLRFAQMLFLNEEELGVALGLLGLGERDDLLDLVDMVVVTYGAEGSVLRTRDLEERVPAVAVRKVVDPTGAGDAYRAGFYAGLHRDRGPRDCCVLGALAAARCLEEVGAQAGYPSWEELEEAFERVGL